MAAAEEEDPEKAAITMAKRMNFLRRTLERQVDDMCKLLFKEVLENDSIPKHKLESTFKALTDIYWSLKLHLAFHVDRERAKEHAELRNLGTHLGLKEELDEYPDMKHARTDPGSRLLKVLGDIAVNSNCPIGSFSHAEEVLSRAKKVFAKYLEDKRPEEWYREDEMAEEGSLIEHGRKKKRNIFKPRVLANAAVSRDNKRFAAVGSSIAVSNFLRPLCLHNRIFKLKPSFKQAIIKGEPLAADETATGWESTAFNNDDYEEKKDPCPTCLNMFQNLKGFISSGSRVGKKSILGGCAEYCPVNNLLPDEDEREVFSKTKKKHMDQCKLLFQTYRSIHDKCVEVYERYLESSKHLDKVCRKEHTFGYSECAEAHDRYEKSRTQLIKVYHEIRPRVHIFGYSPNCPIEIDDDDLP